jgi:hypothetical protein
VYVCSLFVQGTPLIPVSASQSVGTRGSVSPKRRDRGGATGDQGDRRGQDVAVAGARSQGGHSNASMSTTRRGEGIAVPGVARSEVGRSGASVSTTGRGEDVTVPGGARSQVGRSSAGVSTTGRAEDAAVPGGARSTVALSGTMASTSRRDIAGSRQLQAGVGVDLDRAVGATSAAVSVAGSRKRADDGKVVKWDEADDGDDDMRDDSGSDSDDYSDDGDDDGTPGATAGSASGPPVSILDRIAGNAVLFVCMRVHTRDCGVLRG